VTIDIISLAIEKDEAIEGKHKEENSEISATLLGNSSFPF